MPQYEVIFRNKDGIEAAPSMQEGDLKQIEERAKAVGLTPVKVRPATSTTSTTVPPTTTTTQPSNEPGFGTDVASTIGQIGAGAAAGARMPGPPLVKGIASGIGGIVGGLAPYMMKRGGAPSVPETIGVVGSELLPGAKYIPGVGPYIARAGEAASRTVGRAAEPFRRGAAQALESSELIRGTLGRATGAINRQPTQLAGDLLNRLKGVVRTGTEKRVTEEAAAKTGSTLASDVTRTAELLADDTTRVITDAAKQGTSELSKTTTSRIEPMMKDVLTDTLNTYGIDLTKMNEREFLNLLRESPERVAAGISAFETASGQRFLNPGQLQQMWVSDLMQGAGRRVGEAARRGRGLVVDPGGAYILDGKIVSDAWKALTPEGRLTFGPNAAQAFDGLVEALGRLPKAAKGVARLTGAGEKVPMMAPLAAIRKVLMSPSGVLGAGLGGVAGLHYFPRIAETLSEHPIASGAAVLAGGTAATYKIGKRAVKELTDRVLSTDAGVRWLTEGVDMMAKGMPSIMIADTMARSLGRSPQLLQSLGMPQGGEGGPPQVQPPGLFQPPQVAGR